MSTRNTRPRVIVLTSRPGSAFMGGRAGVRVGVVSKITNEGQPLVSGSADPRRAYPRMSAAAVDRHQCISCKSRPACRSAC